MIVYQVYLRSFFDSNADGIGDINGLIQKLDHIASLGAVDYVWISPCFKSPMRDFGYDISNYREIDPQFGSIADFERLIEEAEKRNLKIMIDFVLAHTSSDHDWFQQSRSSRTNPKADWYVWADPKEDGCPPNNWLSELGGSAWQWEPKRQQYYLKHFLPEQPALNWYNPEVLDEMEATLRFWLDRGVKGVRLDALAYAHHDEKLRDNPVRQGALAERASNPFFYQELSLSMGQAAGLPSMKRLRAVADAYDDILFIAEFRTKELALLYTAEGYIHTSYFFDFLTLESLSAQSLQAMISDIQEKFPRKQFFFCMSNHDFARHVSRLNPKPGLESEFARAVAAVMMTLPFNYCMYQGEELGLPKAELTFEQLADPYDRAMWPLGTHRDSARTPMPWNSKSVNAGFSDAPTTWLPVVKEHYAKSVHDQEIAPDSVLDYVRALLEWRKMNIRLSDGLQFTASHNDVLSYEVVRDNKVRLSCYINLGASPVQCALANGAQASYQPQLSFGSQVEGQLIKMDTYGVAIFLHAS
jgi:alpha-glucosidase